MTAAVGPYVLGVDSGGSGMRVALGVVGAEKPVATAVCAAPVRTGPAGIDAGHLLEQLLPATRELLARAGEQERAAEGASIGAVAIGAAGMATLGVSFAPSFRRPWRARSGYDCWRWPPMR